MRVISGKYKGKILEGFNILGTRPTMDRVKESVMGSIQNKIKNSIVLDLFAGSGSIGIETLSNGALKCYFVDNNREILKILNNNLKGINDALVIEKDYLNALDYFKINNIKFDLIYLDPPYKLNLINNSLNKLLSDSLLNNDAIIVLEYEDEKIKIDLKYFNILKEKKYGSKNVIILKYNENKN